MIFFLSLLLGLGLVCRTARARIKKNSNRWLNPFDVPLANSTAESKSQNRIIFPKSSSDKTSNGVDDIMVLAAMDGAWGLRVRICHQDSPSQV